MEQAMIASTVSSVRPVEALISAEIWARFASCTGGRAEVRMLANVLLVRASFELDRGVIPNARWYQHEATERLLSLAAAGDDQAGATLVALADSVIPGGEESAADPQAQETFRQQVSAAAHGDVTALSALFEEAIRSMKSGECDALEALTAAELYSRLGSSTGDVGQLRRLAGVLVTRGEYESNGGCPTIARIAMSEATELSSVLVDAGDAEMMPYLEQLLAGKLKPSAVVAAIARPTVLHFIEPEGNC